MPMNDQYLKEFFGQGSGDHSFSGHIVAPANGTITLDEFAPVPYSIRGLTTKLSAGSCSIAIQINGTNVTGLSSHSATSSQVISIATAAFDVPAGARLTMVISSVSGAADLAFTLDARG